MARKKSTQGQVWEIDNGWNVYAADGDKIGSVEEVHPNYLVVGKGLLFHKEHYVPVSAITNVTDNDVHLGVNKGEIGRQGWDTVPDEREMSTTGMTETTRRTTGRDDVRIPVAEEQLDVRKRDVERGTARVHKDVTERVEHVEVPVREETLRVERHAARDTRPGDIDEHAFQEEDIEIPLRGEEVEVSKRPVVREHVHLGKEVRERDQDVTGTVRREDVHIDDEDTRASDRP